MLLKKEKKRNRNSNLSSTGFLDVKMESLFELLFEVRKSKTRNQPVMTSAILDKIKNPL